jgi:hypothetical protein
VLTGAHPPQGYGGLVPGWAGPTGLALLAGFTPMALIAMFRRRGARKPGEQRRRLFCVDAFTLFYVSHLFYYAYAVLLILHARVR